MNINLTDWENISKKHEMKYVVGVPNWFLYFILYFIFLRCHKNFYVGDFQCQCFKISSFPWEKFPSVLKIRREENWIFTDAADKLIREMRWWQESWRVEWYFIDPFMWSRWRWDIVSIRGRWEGSVRFNHQPKVSIDSAGFV